MKRSIRNRIQNYALYGSMLVILPGMVAVNGCSGAHQLFSGGGAGHSRKAEAVVRIVWPVREPSRLIPVASNSIRITISGPDGFSVTKVIARPATDALFSNLPPGELTVTAAAHPDSLGLTLPAQAQGAQTVVATADEQFQLALTLDSTIDRVEVTGSPAGLDVGTSGSYSVTAKNAAGQVVLTAASKWVWSVSDASLAAVTPNGLTALVTALRPGSVIVSAREAESGKVITHALAVKDPFAATRAALNIDPDHLDNYASPTFPVHYDATVQRAENTPANSPVTDKGATLGRVLFFDKRLSFNDTVACASCHAPGNGFVDSAQFSRGYDGEITTAHAMRLANIRYYTGASMFWDKRAVSVEAQSTQPIQNDVEMGFQAAHGGFGALTAKMDHLAYYPELFKWVFGDAVITEARVQQVLAQFERAMVSVNSKFDTGFSQVFNSAQGGGGVNRPFPNYTTQEERGKTLFLTAPAQGGAGCVTCHSIPTFSLDPRSLSNGLDAGETKIFKSPSLKSVGVTGPYMHDGRFATLLQVVQHYNSGIQNGPALDNRLKTPQGNPLRLNLTVADQNALVAFLMTLTDDVLNVDPKFQNPFK